MKAGIVIDLTKLEIAYECRYSPEIIDGLFVRVKSPKTLRDELIPAAYVYPEENKQQVLIALEKIRHARTEYEKIQSHVYYQVLPKLRSR